MNKMHLNSFSRFSHVADINEGNLLQNGSFHQDITQLRIKYRNSNQNSTEIRKQHHILYFDVVQDRKKCHHTNSYVI